jgi:hypothetical protein
MFTNADAQSQALPLVHALFRDAHSRSGSRMAAYERTAEQIGRSPNWVRKLIGRRADAVVEHRDFLNIRAAYDRLCARIEAAAEHEEARVDALRRTRHAAAREGDRSAVPGVARTAGGGEISRRYAAAGMDAAPLGPRAAGETDHAAPEVISRTSDGQAAS